MNTTKNHSQLSTFNSQLRVTASDVEKACAIDFLEKTAELNDKEFFNKTYDDIKIQKLQNTANFRTQMGIILLSYPIIFYIFTA